MRRSFISISHMVQCCSVAFFLCGCSGLEQTEREKIRRRNCQAEPIYRSHNDFFASIGTPAHTPRSLYPWESEATIPRITKDFFRCKGSLLNPLIVLAPDAPNPTLCTDCDGPRHSLPIFQSKENIYPILLDLLNFVQKRTGKRVIITCGHRCPAHNLYADPSKENRISKHQIGAEVDFYVQGMEDSPQEIAGLLMQYYQEAPLYQNQKEYLQFQRYDKPDARVAIQPWMNKEVFIKIYQRDEGRDRDNQHPYSYLCIQVRYDRDKKERVVYDWERANKGYSSSRL